MEKRLLTLIFGLVGAIALLNGDRVPTIIVITKNSPFFNNVVEGMDGYYAQDKRCRVVLWDTPQTADRDVMRRVVEEVVEKKPDLIIPIGVTLSQLCVEAMRSRPGLSIVFVGPGMPVDQGLVANLDKRAEAVTGVSLAPIDYREPGRQLLLYKPSAQHILIPFCPYAGAGVVEKTATEVGNYLESRGCKVTLLPWHELTEVYEKVEGYIYVVDTVLCVESCWIAEANADLVQLCNKHHVTLFAGDVQSVLIDGAALGYGVFAQDLGVEVLKVAYDILLNGTYPGDVPVVQMTGIRKPLINVEAAKKQGLSMNRELKRLIAMQERSGQWIGRPLSRS